MTTPISASRCGWLAIGGVWATAVAAGLGALFAYSATPGEASNAPQTWPVESALARSATHYTLVVVAHPKCPCTHATVSELARMMVDLRGSVSVVMLFVRTEPRAPGWHKTELWRRAAAIDGVELVDDLGGREAARFGTVTSGATLLFSPEGELLFSGGITPTRAHEGNSVGRRRIVELVRRGHTDRHTSDVFGCELGDHGDPLQ